LKFHPDKCKSVTYGKSSSSHDHYKLKIKDTEYNLKQDVTEKDVGVTFDTNVWTAQKNLQTL
jgi:hypothetical protein